MDRERERERIGARSDAASLWIDFVLLPPKLEEHLAAGPAAIPSPPDLISMFLEQALLNQKTVNGGSSGNIASKDVETQGMVKVASKTAAVLCERAARVAVAAKLTLAEIELSLASQQHQFVLLKTLIRHDEGRSLLHQCNLHRWLLHKALQCHPVGSAAPNAAFPTTRLGFSTAGDDLGEVFHNIMNGNGDASSFSGPGESLIEEERPSVDFLEQVLKDEDFSRQTLEEQGGLPTNEICAKPCNKSSLQQDSENGGSSKEVLSSAYKCEIMFDIAEVHFMRGRIRQAYDFFIRCKASLSFLSEPMGTSGIEDEEDKVSTSMNTGQQELPVPQDRLAGFIIACRMLLSGVPPTESTSQTKTEARGPILVEVVPAFCAPSPAQRAVIASEQSRWIARRYSRVGGGSHCDPGSCGVVSRKAVLKRGTSEITRDDVTCANIGDRSTEDSASYRQIKRIRSSKYRGDHNAYSGPIEPRAENGESMRNATEAQMKAPHVSGSEPLETQHGGLSGAAVKENSTNEMDPRETKRVEVNVTKGERSAAHGKYGIGVDESHNNYTKLVTYSDKDQVMSNAGHGTQIKLLIDLRGASGEDAFYEFDIVAKAAVTEKQQERLIQTFVEDILRGHLSWAYCLSVEKDPTLSELDRSKVAACNLVRCVLEGGSVESFLRVSDLFEDSKDAVEFLMQLLLAVKVMEEGNISATKGSCDVDSRLEERLTELGFSKRAPIAQGTGETRSVVVQRVHDLAMYVCCVIDEPWCWDCAVEHRLAGKADPLRFDSPCPSDWSKPFVSSVTCERSASGLNSSLESGSKNMEETKLMSVSDILMSLLQLETVTEIEAFVEGFRSVEGRGSTEEVSIEVEQSSRKGLLENRAAPIVNTFDSMFSPQSRTLSVPSCSHQEQDTTNFKIIPSNDVVRGGAAGIVGTTYSYVQVWSTFEADVASILKRRAFTALEVSKDTHVATRLYQLALGFLPEDLDCVMMLWLFERTSDIEGRTEGRVVSPWSRSLPAKCERSSLPSSVLLEFAILFLIEKELWQFLSEICKWALSLLKDGTSRENELNTKSESDSASGGAGFSGTRCETSTKIVATPWEFKHQRLSQTLKLGTILSDLLPLCISLQAAASRNHFNEDVARLGATLSQLFEEFMCVLTGVESGGQVQGNDDTPDWRVTLSGMNLSPPYTGAALAPLVSKVSNPRALMALASLTAGWLQRCHAAGLLTWPLAVARYGVLAAATAGPTLPPPPGSLSYASSVLRPVPPRVPPEFGRDLFGVLLETIVSIPGVVEGDREKGHRWLQGLADLAFEDDAHVKALRLYLQAGAIRSAHYCDRSSSMDRSIFTIWVIQRMVAACRAIGAGVQAAVLCQCPPAPEHELAFRILQENSLIVDRDAAAYFECLWEVPILELLVNLHAKAGDEERVNSLIGLLQQPALNVHNPPAIRQAHICTMEQRFLQRLAGELLE